MFHYSDHKSPQVDFTLWQTQQVYNPQQPPVQLT